MKFLHAADIHLDSPLEGLERYEGAPVDLIRGATRRALENLVELAVDEQVDFVVIAGDLYDGDWRDFNTGMFFVRQMARLSEAGITVSLIAGNHDAASTMTRKLRLPANPDGTGMMFSHEQAETRRLEHLGVAIHGRSFANQAEIRNMVPDYPQPIARWFNLGMLHTSLNGSEEHDTYAPCTPTELRSKGYDYWALGHIHKRSLLPSDGVPLGSPPIVYSGNIQGRHTRETGPRGCFLVSVDERQRVELEFRTLDVFRWEICAVSCINAASADQVLEQFREQLKSLIRQHAHRPLGVRVILNGASKAHQELTSHRTRIIAEIRSTATIVSDGHVWIEQVRIATSYPQEQEVSFDDQGPLAELNRYLDELPNNTVALEQLAAELKDLARKLPAELLLPPEGLLLDHTDWIRDQIKDVKPLLREFLKG
jgi:exonuclease SbcD